MPLPKFQLKTITGDAAVAAVPVRIMAIEIADVDSDCTLELTNDANGAGTNLLVVTCAAEQGGCFRDYTNLGGVYFSSKCYCDLTNAAVVHFWLG